MGAAAADPTRRQGRAAGVEGPAMARPKKPAGFTRQDALDFIIRKFPPQGPVELTEVIEAFCELRLKTMPDYRREWLEELAGELGVEELVRGERLPAVPTRAEMRQLLQAPDLPRDRLMFRVLYASGVRVGELVQLTFADVRFGERLLFVRAGKGNQDRYALIDEETCEQLAAWQGEQGPEARVFGLSVRQVQRLVEKWGKRTGLHQVYAAMRRNLTPHSFRHAFATHAYENGMDLFTLKKLLGHDRLDTTEQYIEVGMNRWRAAYDQCHPMGRKARQMGGMTE